ncbi:MAG: hypothetical protein MRY64_11065 [Hyphomonadaceae bacterium]|nr:hypothetical protein [Hyphomonadaceae bacterium]
MKRLLFTLLAGLFAAHAQATPLDQIVGDTCMDLISVEKSAIEELGRGGVTPDQFCTCYGAEAAALGRQTGKLHVRILQTAMDIRANEGIDGLAAIRQLNRRTRNGESAFTEDQMDAWDDLFDDSFGLTQSGEACGAS